MRPRHILDPDFLKGGQGSGNFGHSGRPGERGGSAPGEGGESIMSPPAKETLAPSERLRASETGNVHPESAKVIADTLDGLPASVQRYLSDTGVKLDIRSSDQPGREFTVGDRKFVEGGHADYITRELMVREVKSMMDTVRTRAVAEIAAHESGHFAAEGLWAYSAKLEDRFDSLDLRSEEIRNELHRLYTTGGDFAARESLLKAELAGVQREKFDLVKTTDLFRQFQQSTQDEGGFTDYSNSYVQAGDMFGSTIQYTGPLEYTQGAAKGRIAFLPNTANENFAEIFSAIYGAKGFYRTLDPNPEPHLMTTTAQKSARKATLTRLKTKYPRTYKAFTGLLRILERKGFRLPKEVKYGRN